MGRALGITYDDGFALFRAAVRVDVLFVCVQMQCPRIVDSAERGKKLETIPSGEARRR